MLNGDLWTTSLFIFQILRLNFKTPISSTTVWIHKHTHIYIYNAPNDMQWFKNKHDSKILPKCTLLLISFVQTYFFGRSRCRLNILCVTALALHFPVVNSSQIFFSFKKSVQTSLHSTALWNWLNLNCKQLLSRKAQSLAEVDNTSLSRFNRNVLQYISYNWRRGLSGNC